MVCWWRGIWFAGQDQFDRSTAWSSTTCAGLWVVCRFLRGKTTAGVNILCAAKDRKLARERGFNGSTVRRIGLRPLVLVFGLPLVVLRCKTTAGLPIFASRKIGSWCRKEDSNLRPIAYEATALPTELSRRRAIIT